MLTHAPDDYSTVYENSGNGIFILDKPEITVGKVTKLTCLRMDVLGKPFYRVEALSGAIDKNIIRYVPRIRVENYSDLPLKMISGDELPSLLEKLSILIKVSKKGGLVKNRGGFVSIRLKLEAIPEVPYMILFDDLNNQYTINNVDFNAILINEKETN